MRNSTINKAPEGYIKTVYKVSCDTCKTKTDIIRYEYIGNRWKKTCKECDDKLKAEIDIALAPKKRKDKI